MTTDNKVKLGELFRNRKEPGSPGSTLMSVTLNNGLVERGTLDRKTDTELTPEEHLAIRKGDIAYNMMRMWQGASGLAGHDGIVSPAYVVVAPKDGIDPRFASYWFKSSRMIHLFWAYSYGLTKDRLRLYFKDFSLIPIDPPPPLERQEWIVNVLSTWDTAIETTQKLIEAKKKLKNGLMQQLFTGKRRFPEFSEKWQPVEFGNVATISKARFDPRSQSPSQACIELEHISQGDGRLLGTVDSENQNSTKAVFSKGDVLFGKLRPYLRKFFHPRFNGVCSTEIWVLKANQRICSSEYLYRLVQTDRFISAASVSTGSKMPRAEWSWVAEQPFLIPSLREQNRITKFLSTLDCENANLCEMRDRLNIQKKGLMQRLLTGQIRVKEGSDD